MFEKLSDKQREIVDSADKRIVVKACPGSGKTFSVTARLAKLIQDNKLNRHQGIATLSFTNTACDEIRKGIKVNFGIEDISYPHYIGTLDSFINNYIFLPYGHLFMKCPSRPEIIGTEYNKWFDYDHSKTTYGYDRKTNKKFITARDPNYYFDKVSFDINKAPMRLFAAKEYHFSWKKTMKNNGEYCKCILDILSSKENNFKESRANQADANYIALQILQQYPIITSNIVERFPYIIIDEAQDTTAIQMAIIDILDNAQIESLMLIGDPDQAIFEWNTADPSLFLNKYESEEWKSIELNENRRSSDNICNVINRFFNGNVESVAADKLCQEVPIIKTYNPDTLDSVASIESDFINKCSELNIDIDDVAVVYRGKTFAEKYFGIIKDDIATNNSVWVQDCSYVRDVVHGKYLLDNGNHKRGTQLIAKGILKKKLNVNYISSIQIKNEIDNIGFRNYRGKLAEYINKLPHTDTELIEWVNSAEANGLKFSINKLSANIHIDQLFQKDATPNSITNSHIRTIHSVKGMSLEAILVFLTKKGGSTNFSTILSKRYDELTPEQQELLRIVYVACSRPKKILWFAVPEEDIEIWNDKLQIKNS